MNGREPLGAADRFAGAGDTVYEMLLVAHEGLSEAESDALNARLVLVLAHAVGDPARVGEAIALARSGGGRPQDPC